MDTYKPTTPRYTIAYVDNQLNLCDNGDVLLLNPSETTIYINYHLDILNELLDVLNYPFGKTHQ